MKTLARYFIGAALLMEGVVLSVNSAETQNLYIFQLIKVMGDSQVGSTICIALLQAIYFGAGALTISNSSTGF